MAGDLVQAAALVELLRRARAGSDTARRIWYGLIDDEDDTAAHRNRPTDPPRHRAASTGRADSGRTAMGIGSQVTVTVTLDG